MPKHRLVISPDLCHKVYHHGSHGPEMRTMPTCVSFAVQLLESVRSAKWPLQSRYGFQGQREAQRALVAHWFKEIWAKSVKQRVSHCQAVVQNEPNIELHPWTKTKRFSGPTLIWFQLSLWWFFHVAKHQCKALNFGHGSSHQARYCLYCMLYRHHALRGFVPR